MNTALNRSLLDGFSTDELDRIARETGFTKRKSKVTPSAFFDLLMFDVGSGGSKSLQQISIEAISEHNIDVSKQGVDKRFNECAIDFLKRLMEKQLSVEMSEQIDVGWLHYFNRVLIKDGTRFDIREAYKLFFPGSGGSASEAGACIQFEFDLKSGLINHLGITPSRRPDIRDTLDGLDNIQSGDLVIRDLGYYSYKSFEDISKKGAFYISRFVPKGTAYEKIDDQLRKIEFKPIYQYMRKHKLSRMCKDVYIGTKEKFNVRMIIELMPDEVYEQRMRKIEKAHQKKGHKTSDEYKFISRFNIFITNVQNEILPDNVISSLYRMRWQVEIIFKVFKSVFGVHQYHSMKYIRWLCLLHFKLLIIILNWNIVMTRRSYLYKKSSKLLSVLKCFRSLFDNHHRLRRAIKRGKSEMRKFLIWTEKILSRNHWLEDKKTMSLSKIFEYNNLEITSI
ncbi:MAG: IS4 family transposase [Nitrososphaeraceae archaeon]